MKRRKQRSETDRTRDSHPHINPRTEDIDLLSRTTTAHPPPVVEDQLPFPLWFLPRLLPRLWIQLGRLGEGLEERLERRPFRVAGREERLLQDVLFFYRKLG